jgi:copper chaperone/Cu+-exporting ATPase
MTHTLTISGMTCDHCVRRVTKALSRVDGLGVRDVEVGRAVIDDGGDRSRVDLAVAAVKEVGYDAELES